MTQLESPKKGSIKGLINQKFTTANKRPTQAFTRKGNRVYRHCTKRGDNPKFSECYTFRQKKNGRQHYFNLGSDLDTAKKLADQIGAFLSIRDHQVADVYSHPSFTSLRSPRSGSDLRRHAVSTPTKHVPTIGEFCRKYETAASGLSRKTVTVAISSLERIAAFELGLPPLGKSVKAADRLKWRNKVENCFLDRITQSVIERFRDDMIRRAGNHQLQKSCSVTSANTYIRCAGTMYSSKWAVHYENFEMPDPNPFKLIRRHPEAAHRYVSTMNPVTLYESARAELETASPPVFVVFILALWAGMRRAEIDRLTWDQVDLVKGHIWIRTTEFFRPKAKNSESRIDIPEEIVTVLAHFKESKAPSIFVVPGSTRVSVQIRCSGTFKRLIKWLRLKGVSQTTALHTLRKEAGSLIYHRTGSVDSAADFLRNDPRVAREHYLGRKGRLELTLQ